MRWQLIPKQKQLKDDGSRVIWTTARILVASSHTVKIQRDSTRIAPTRRTTAGPDVMNVVLMALETVLAVVLMVVIRITVKIRAVHLHTAQMKQRKTRAVIVCLLNAGLAVPAASQIKVLDHRA